MGRLSEIRDAVDAAERTSREYLLGNGGTPAPHVIQALPMDVPVNLDSTGRSAYFARSLLRGVGIATRSRHGAGYVIVKMARLYVFGTVASGNERREWRNTQLHASGGAWGVDTWHVPGWVRHYFDYQAKHVERLVEGLSEKQKDQTNDRIWAELRTDVEGLAESDVFRAFEADLKLFGDRAFQSE